MTKILKFIPKEKPKPEPLGFTCSLNRALLAAQYATLVLDDQDTAFCILEVLLGCPDLSQPIVMPGRLREAVENTDSTATYRAILEGPPPDA
jgi:hypothetical protein